MGEYEFYGSKGFTQNSLQDRRYAFFGGPPGSISDLRRSWYLTQLGLTGAQVGLSNVDLEIAYYKSIGGVGSLQDMRSQYWSGKIAPVPVGPNPPVVVGSTHNGNNGLANIVATIPAGATTGDTVLLVATLTSSTYDLGTLPDGWSVLVNSVVNTRRGILLVANYDPALVLTVPLTGATGAAVGTVLARSVTSRTVGSVWRRTENGGAQALIKAPSVPLTKKALVLGFFCEASSATADGYTLSVGTVVFDHLNDPGPLSSGAESLVAAALTTETASDIDVVWNNATSQNGQGWELVLYST